MGCPIYNGTWSDQERLKVDLFSKMVSWQPNRFKSIIKENVKIKNFSI